MTFHCGGNITYDPYKEICCSGQIIQRRGSHDACCHGSSYLSDTQVCCEGVILPKTSGGCDVPNVCRQSPTRFLTKTQACCGGVLYPLSKAKDHGCCFNVKPFKYDDEICCSGVVHAQHGNTECCVTRAYDSDTQMCCAGEIKTKTPQGCGSLNSTLVDICKNSPIPRYFPKEGFGCCAGEVRAETTHFQIVSIIETLRFQDTNTTASASSIQQNS